MLSKFLDHIEGQNINTSTSSFLLAVSGGMDSMFMLDLCVTLKYKIGVAHINHNLRADESLQDQHFIQDYCIKKDIPFYLHSIDPSVFQSSNMHEVARTERYTFLNKIKEEHGYTHVCTAHHVDDSIESFLFNFSRGSGLKGLSGIKSNSNAYLRPIIHYSQAEIHEFVLKQKIEYREDSSNASTKYTRNKLRHQVIPILKESFPSFSQTAGVTIQNLGDANILLHEFITHWASQNCTQINEEYRISKDPLNNHKGNTSLLHGLIHPFGFNRSQVMNILASTNSVGSLFYSTEYELLIDRKEFIIRPTTSKQEHGVLHTEVVTKFELIDDPLIEIIDAQNIELPLEVRSISPGQKMQPLGMKGLSKKVSDIFIDKKISRFDKEKIKMVYSGETPVWLVGITIDERFKVSNKCTSMIKLEFRTKR